VYNIQTWIRIHTYNESYTLVIVIIIVIIIIIIIMFTSPSTS